MILVSSCLAGFKVRYNGTDAQNMTVRWLVTHGQAITVCPEIMTGFSTPRPSAEIVGGSAGDVLNGKAYVKECNGNDVTAKYIAGAQMVLEIVRRNNVQVAFLKENSPSCGVNNVYTGLFNGQLLHGSGITAHVLKTEGIQVYSDLELNYAKVKPFVSANVSKMLKSEIH
ncbi:DUF523 domain-containing protein [Liquorilactobacillus uvarum]|uniref:Uncharacterized protein n=1 Tax=Liquorilactobacillus uvarum DSM 19971 TaxID=1423812 RepID=A0A0R1QAG5_9LACO|nr:DUF523 domain-containing protein [Liquorilactobacillus uvarum]KRL37912.1 hypothetical protein FD20_GL002450 [Liquorilactobacillus uvarum DSM 19971]